MTNFAFPVQLTPDIDGGYVVTFRDLPEAITQGDSIAECLKEASDCLEEAIAARIDDNLEIPQPSLIKEREYLVYLPLSMVFKTLVYLSFQETKMSKSQLANKLNLDEKELKKILNPREITELSTLDKIFSALGKQLDIRLI
jgi:antitoxin HicB